MHDGAEGGFRIVLQEAFDVDRALNRRFYAVIGVNAKEPEGQRGVKSFFVGPFGAGKGIRHVLDILLAGRCNAAKYRRSARVVDAFAHMPDRRQFVDGQKLLQGLAGFCGASLAAEAEL